MGRQGLTEDAMPLQRASLGQTGYNTHAVSSLPTIISAEIWITAMKTQSKTNQLWLAVTTIQEALV